MQQRVRVFGIVLMLIFMSGCWIPEKFDAHIDFNKDGSYSFYYDGILTHAFVAEVFYKDKMSEKDEDSFKKEVIDDLNKKPEFKEVRYLGKGKFKVKVIKNGSINEAYYFPMHESETKIFAILPQKDGSVSVKAFLPDRKTIQDLKEVGVKIDGTLEISVAHGLNVIKHNAQSIPILFSFLGAYKWHIESLDEEPFITIQKFHSSNSDTIKSYNEISKSSHSTSPITIVSNLLSEVVQSVKRFFIINDLWIKNHEESLFGSSKDQVEQTPKENPGTATRANITHIQDQVNNPVVPMHKQGDTYVSQSINLDTGGIVNVIERKVITANPERIITESRNLKSKSGSVRKLDFTPEWNLMAIRNPDGGGLDYSPPLKYYEFPLVSGKTWRQMSIETDIKTAAIREHTLSAVVGEWETVTVPAGTFRGIKVTIQTELLDRSTGKRSTGTDTSWYVPEVRKSVRSLTSSRSPEGVESRQDSQLISFNLIGLSEYSSTINQFINTPRPTQSQSNLLIGASIVDKSIRSEYASEDKIKTNDSRLGNYNLYRLIDDNPNSLWSTDAADPQYVVFQLAWLSAIQEIDFANRFAGHRGPDEGCDATKVVEIFSSMDTKNQSNTAWTRLGEFTLAGPQAYRTKSGGGYNENETLQRFAVPETDARLLKIVFKENYWDQSIFQKWPTLKDELGYSMGEIYAIGTKH